MASTNPFDIFKTGISPSIRGDDTTALIAQINRFQKRFGGAEYPLATGTIPIEVAAAAMGILQNRLVAAIGQMPDDPSLSTQLKEISAAMRDPVLYVTPRLPQVTRVLALYGDSIGLPSAKVGITGTRWSAAKWATALAIVVLGGFAAHRLYRYQQRRLLH